LVSAGSVQLTGSAPDVNGGNLSLASGSSTGAGESYIDFKTVSAGASGTTINSASTKMIIEASGNVGIGTITPSEKLQVAGNIRGTELCIGPDCRSAWPVPGSGTVTSVATGTGLTGGPITGSGTVSIANQGVGTLQLANDAVTTSQILNGTILNADISANTINAVTKLTSACTNNQILQVSGAGGNFVCANLPTPPPAPVTSVFGRTGVILAVDDDYTASQINNTAAGAIAATDVQAAINELDTEKLALAGGTVTGDITMSGADLRGLPATPAIASSAASKAYVDAQVISAGATSLNDLSDARTTFRSLHIGSIAGGASDLENTAIGLQSMTSLSDNDAFGNTAVGYQAAMTLNAGDQNTAVGSYAGSFLTSGGYNTFLGSATGTSMSSGGENTAVGAYALNAASTATNNTAIGTLALTIATGSNNTVLGYQGGDSITSGSGNILIGYDVDTPTPTTSNYLNLGNTIYGDILNGNVGIGTTSPQYNLHVSAADTQAAILVQNESSTGFQSPNVYVSNYDGTGFGGHPKFLGVNRRGSSAAPVAIQTGDVLLAVEALGGSDAIYNTQTGAGVQFVATENFSASTAGTATVFYNAPNGSNASTETLRIDHNGNVGIGTSTPGFKFQVEEFSDQTTAGEKAASFNYLYADPSASSAAKFIGQFNGVENGGATAVITGEIVGQASYSSHNSVNSITKLSGSWSGTNNTSTGLVTVAVGSQAEIENTSTGVITSAFGFQSGVLNTGGGTITNGYGLYVDSVAATNKWSIYASDATAPSYFAGRVGIGTNTPEVELDVNNGTINAAALCDENNANCLDLSAGIRANSVRRQSGEPVTGLVTGNIYYDTDDDITYVYTGAAWTPLAQSGDSNSIISVADPTTIFMPQAGNVAFNSTSGELEFYNGASWVSTVNVAGTGDFLADGSVAMTDQLLAFPGAFAVPSYSFAGDSNTGIQGAGDGLMAFITNGSIRFYLDNGGLTSSIVGGAKINPETGIPTAATFSFNGDEDTGIYRPADNEIGFTSSGVESMRIDSMGRVGIGTINPGVRLEVNGNLHVKTAGSALMSTDGAPGTIRGLSFRSTSNNRWYLIADNAAESGAESGSDFRIRRYDDAGAVIDDSLIIQRSTGNVAIGDFIPIHPLEIASGAHVTAAGVWTDASDVKLKENIKPMDSYGLETVLKLEPKSYNMKAGGREQIGFIAQDVEKIVPEVVSKKGRFWGISYGQLSTVVVQAVQEFYQEFRETAASLYKSIDANKERITQLELKNQKLEKELKEIKRMLLLNQQPASR
jgi:hypothetical protein